MALSCIICLDQLRTPVSLPCGHIFCEACLNSQINANTSTLTGRFSCPACRTLYPASMTHDRILADPPNGAYPLVRKLFLDDLSIPESTGSYGPRNQNLLARIAQLETRVADLKRDKEKLMKESVAQLKYLKHYVEERRQAQLDVAKAKEEAWDMRKKYEVLKQRYVNLQNHLRPPHPDGIGRNRNILPTGNVLRRPQPENPLKLQAIAWRQLVRRK